MNITGSNRINFSGKKIDHQTRWEEEVGRREKEEDGVSRQEEVVRGREGGDGVVEEE